MVTDDLFCFFHSIKMVKDVGQWCGIMDILRDIALMTEGGLT